MILGNKYGRLAKRVNAALLSGNADPHEAVFLHKIWMRIDKYGQNALLSDGQVKWLSELVHRLCPTQSDATPSSLSLALEEILDVNKSEIDGPEKLNETPSSDCPGQPKSSLVPKDAFADVPHALISECFGTAKARQRHSYLLQKYGRKLWIEKLLRGDFELDRPAGKPFVSI